MEVVYSEALIAYMKKKGYSFISVESISPKHRIACYFCF